MIILGGYTMTVTREKVVDLQRLGERLLLTRRRKGLSQGELAQVAQVDLSLISRIERGVKPSLSVEVLGRLATALDTSPNDLLGWEERQPAPPAPKTTPKRQRTRAAKLLNEKGA
jgi:transcriptional regulator with XRE-family HTH domain